MIFEHTWPMVMQRNKTRTSRLIKGVNLCLDMNGTPGATDSPWFNTMTGPFRAVMTEPGKVIYQVGHTHAVQPGRTQPAIWWLPETGRFQVGRPNRLPAWHTWQQARIRILRIEMQDVRAITLPQAKAEGFTGEIPFWQIWCRMHDPKLPFSTTRRGRFVDDVARPVAEIRRELMTRPDKFYRAWVLHFELVV